MKNKYLKFFTDIGYSKAEASELQEYFLKNKINPERVVVTLRLRLKKKKPSEKQIREMFDHLLKLISEGKGADAP